MKKGEIEAIIWEHFKPDPAKKAAAALMMRGVYEKDLAKIKPRTLIPEPMFIAVQNAMRDMQRGVK